MSAKTEQVSIYTISFLDVIGATFATILLVYVLLLVRMERIDARLNESRFIVLAVRIVGLDDHDRADPDIVVNARLELIAPPRQGHRNLEVPFRIPAEWSQLQLPYDDCIVQGVCSEVIAHANADFTYCVLRGVRPAQCLFRLSFYATSGSDRLRKVRLEGWLASPSGRTPLSGVVQHHLSTPVQADPADSKVLEFARTDNTSDWLKAVVVLRAVMQARDAQE